MRNDIESSNVLSAVVTTWWRHPNIKQYLYGAIVFTDPGGVYDDLMFLINIVEIKQNESY